MPGIIKKNVIAILLKFYRAAVEEKDDDGEVILVLAIKSGQTTENDVRSLYDA